MLSRWLNMIKTHRFLLCACAVTILIYLVYSDPISHSNEFVLASGKSSFSADVCRDVLEIRYPNPNQNSTRVNVAVDLIRKAKETKTFLDEEAYAELGKDDMRTVQYVEPLYGINGSNLTLLNTSLLDKLNWELPYLPCKLKRYEAEDVKHCTKQRLVTSMSTRIAYLGDSKIRQHLEVFLDLLRPFNLTITNYKGELISLDEFLGTKGNKYWTKYKNRLTVTSEDLSGFMIDFVWAPDLPKGDPERLEAKKQIFESGAYDVLRSMISLPAEEIPSIIILGSAVWQLLPFTNILRNIDLQLISGMKQLYPVLESLAQRTSIVWMLPEPIKEYGTVEAEKGKYSLLKNANLEWYLNGQVQLLPDNVQVWDSFMPVAHAASDDCFDLGFSHSVDLTKLPPYSQFDPIHSYSCIERIHVGFRSIYTGVQLLLNHLCNHAIAEKSKGFCCSKNLSDWSE